jgi:hypothetical protein
MEKRRYVKIGTVPRKIPEGTVLVHNHIRHTADTPAGTDGFRAWAQAREPNLIPCDCGWAGLEHFRPAPLR